MTEKELFNAAPCDGIAKGTVVMLVDDKIVYAGPIKQSPDSGGKMLLMNAADFELLRSRVAQSRH